MRVLVQKVKEASVSIDSKVHSSIDKGLLVFLGITHEDKESDIEWLVNKILHLRIFCDANGRMNISMLDIDDAQLLVVSQFTLYASTKKGNRPSYLRSAKPPFAEEMYTSFLAYCKSKLGSVKSGVFGADMKVSLINDGPVTIIIDTELKE